MTEFIPVPSPGETLYYGEPGDPLVVVIHDWFGRLPWVEAFAIALTREGLQVAVPDLYNGRATIDPNVATAMGEQLDVGECLSIIDDLIDEARLYGTRRVGEVGFSTGGWLALVHAQGGEVDAAVAYYASLAEQHHGVIPCPVMLQYPENDDWEYGGNPLSFVDRLGEHGTPVTRFGYAGARHHFANTDVPGRAEPNAAALAHARTAAFLSAQLLG